MSDVTERGVQAQRRVVADADLEVRRPLAALADTVFPIGVVPLVADLLAGHRPVHPVELPWHHQR